MRVIAYTYDADTHCIDCTKKRFENQSGKPDEHGVPIDAKDCDGNSIHPVFSTDETDNSAHCCDCSDPLFN